MELVSSKLYYQQKKNIQFQIKLEKKAQTIPLKTSKLMKKRLFFFSYFELSIEKEVLPLMPAIL